MHVYDNNLFIQNHLVMRNLHIIMPMAGEGSRFANAGWTTPKPLIEFHGLPLFKHAISSVASDGIEMKYSFIVRNEHIIKYGIDKNIKAFLPEANVFSVMKTTRGAVETCLIAESAIDNDDAIIVMDCDLEFRSSKFIQIIKKTLSKPSCEVNGGALVSFESNQPKYSYAEVGEDGLVKRTAEKEVISNHALCGAYFFSTGKRFKEIAHKLLNEANFKKPEFYVSLLYNYMLEDGETVEIAPIEEYYSYGTPEELNKYL